MLASQIPTKFPIPFGNNAAAGTIRTVPQASQTAIDIGQASLTDGFPVATGQPLASGGKPPSMQDFNGLLNQISAWSRWQGAGGTVAFDQGFCTAIGGYPQGAMLASTIAGKLWLSTVDSNMTNPDGGSPSGWLPILAGPAIINQFPTASFVPLPGISVPSDTPYVDWTPPAGYDFFRLTGFLRGPASNANVYVSIDGSTFLTSTSNYQAGYGNTNTAANPYVTNPYYAANGLNFSNIIDLATGFSTVLSSLYVGSANTPVTMFGSAYGEVNGTGYQAASFMSNVNQNGRAQKFRFYASTSTANQYIRGGSYIGIEGFKYS